MSEEKNFFKTCFNIVAGLDIKNESQAIAKEVVLSEIENLQQENKQLKEVIYKANEMLKKVLVIKCGGIYRPIKNTTKQEVYKAIALLNNLLNTPFRIKEDKILLSIIQDQVKDCEVSE